MLERDKVPQFDTVYGEQRAIGNGINEQQKNALLGNYVAGQKQTYNNRVI